MSDADATAAAASRVYDIQIASNTACCGHCKGIKGMHSCGNERFFEPQAPNVLHTCDIEQPCRPADKK
jgi:hypothetical protein